MLSVDAVEPTIKKMPPELQQQVLRYIETLSISAGEKHHGTMKFEWAGCCEDMKNELYISTTDWIDFSPG